MDRLGGVLDAVGAWAFSVRSRSHHPRDVPRDEATKNRRNDHTTKRRNNHTSDYQILVCPSMYVNIRNCYTHQHFITTVVARMIARSHRHYHRAVSNAQITTTLPMQKFPRPPSVGLGLSWSPLGWVWRCLGDLLGRPLLRWSRLGELLALSWTTVWPCWAVGSHAYVFGVSWAVLQAF